MTTTAGRLAALFALLVSTAALLAGCGGVYRADPSPLAKSSIREANEARRNEDQDRAIAVLEKAAATGDPFAEQRAARAYLFGPEATRDPERAEVLLRRSVSKRSAVRGQALLDLATLVEPEDPAEALALLQEAQAVGADVPPADLGRLLVATGADEAGRDLLEDSARAGDIGALEALVDLHIAEDNRPLARRDARRLADAYERQYANTGETNAAFRLARLHDEGRGLARDPQEALRWYTAAAEGGDVRAMRALARSYLLPESGVASDPVQGRRWAEEAIARDDVSTRAIFGQALIRGDVVDQDVDRGIALLEEAAARGHTGAATALGRTYAEGTVVEANPARAIELLQGAAEGGQVSALVVMGRMYWDGDVVPRDETYALELMRDAAAQGHGGAQRFLARNG